MCVLIMPGLTTCKSVSGQREAGPRLRPLCAFKYVFRMCGWLCRKESGVAERPPLRCV